jgi:hypothetical protein
VKKLLFLFLFVFLNAASVEYYLYSVNVDYKEYDDNGVYLDGESSSFGMLNGLGVKFSDKKNVFYYLKGEYAYGNTDYDGRTWGGIPLSYRENNVYLYTLEGGIHPFNNPYYMAFGYRFWNRGKSDYAGDYNEQYYWPYFGMGYDYVFKLQDTYVTADFAYQRAVDPKLETDFGSGAKLDLGLTEGLKFQVGGYFKIKRNVFFSVMYRYQFWHINRSASVNVNYNGRVISIHEPESYTRNQYLGAGVLYRF